MFLILPVEGSKFAKCEQGCRRWLSLSLFWVVYFCEGPKRRSPTKLEGRRTKSPKDFTTQVTNRLLLSLIWELFAFDEVMSQFCSNSCLIIQDSIYFQAFIHSMVARIVEQAQKHEIFGAYLLPLLAIFLLGPSVRFIFPPKDHFDCRQIA